MSQSNIIRALKIGGWLAAKDVAMLMACSVRACYAGLDRLVRSGVVEKRLVKAGEGRPHAEYRLSEKEVEE